MSGLVMRSIGTPCSKDTAPAKHCQNSTLLHRLSLIRAAIMSVYGAILLLVVDMLVIALAVVSAADWLTTAILIVFLAGIGALFLGIALTVVEARQSQRAIRFEVQRVLALPRL